MSASTLALPHRFAPSSRAATPARPGALAAARRWLGRKAMALLPSLPAPLRDAAVLRLLKADLTGLEDVVVKVAETADEHEQAARLVYGSYADCGLVTDQRGVPVRVNAFLMLPSTLKFIAVRNGEVLATLSLIQDSGLGLPVEKAFPGSVDALRSQGRRVAEIGALAVKAAHRRHGLTMLLYKAMWRTASEVLGVEDLVVSVRPSAAPIYAASLRFERLVEGEGRYTGLASPVVALRLDLISAPRVFRRAFATERRGQFNPRVFFLETDHAQLQLPTTPAALAPLREAQRRAALRLACLRPDAVMSLEPKAFDALRQAMAA